MSKKLPQIKTQSLSEMASPTRKLESQIHILKGSVKQWEQKYKELQKEIIGMESASEIFAQLDAEHRAPHTITKEFFKGDEASVVAVLSDIHAEEVIEAKKVNGLNEFNPQICRDRMDKFFKKTLMLTEHERTIVPVPRLILPILGDCISGAIHDDLIADNALQPIEAISFVEEMIESGLDFLLDHGNFKEIIIPCAVGNHGRITKKPRCSSAIGNNLESLMFAHLQKIFALKSKKVKFVVPQGYHTYVELYGKTIRCHHGDAIKYQGGVGGISIPVNKAIANWNVGKKADLEVFGHWHQFLDGGRWISNGSVIGFGPYSLAIKAQYEIPQQAFVVLDKKHWKTAVRPIFLD